jgi:hypothetical protein
LENKLMKQRIIRNLMVTILTLILSLPWTVSATSEDTELHFPTLDPFNWPIVSLHGPRYLTSSKFHAGIDFSPLPGDADLGYMIKSRTAGRIIDFIKGSSGGWRLVVRPPAEIQLLHKSTDFFYMHLFRNDGTVPKIIESDAGYTKLEAVKVNGLPSPKSPKFAAPPKPIICDGIAFWKDTILLKVLTKEACNGGTYGSHKDVPVTSKIAVNDEIAPMGNSHNSTIQAHLHFGMNFGSGSSNRANPFYALERTHIEPGEPYFSAMLWKDSEDSKKLFSTTGFWVDVTSRSEYSLDKIELKLIKSGGAIESLSEFSFGGRPGESKFNLSTEQIILIAADKDCTNKPSRSYSKPVTVACGWNGTPATRKWRFFAPYDITSLPGGTHQLCTNMISINGYANTRDSCESFDTDCKIGDKCHGGIVFYVDATGKHGLVASPNDLGFFAWNDIDEREALVTTGATGDGVGAGAANTKQIIAVQGSGSYAAMVAKNYDGGGYNDWYLPSIHELSLLHQQREIVGGFPEIIDPFDFGFFNVYYSSTEHTAIDAWVLSFPDGVLALNYKRFGSVVRAIRAF